MKKILICLIVFLLILTGCGKKEKTMQLECKMNATTITLTVEKGKIIKYVDQIKGELSESEIDILNKSYLENVQDNKEAIIKLREVIASNGGDCK